VASANAASNVMAVVTTVAVAVVTKANTKAKKGPPAAGRGLLISPGPVAGARPLAGPAGLPVASGRHPAGPSETGQGGHSDLFEAGSRGVALFQLRVHATRRTKC
jgi:hypothetical protein